jgi:hypothetical protein
MDNNGRFLQHHIRSSANPSEFLPERARRTDARGDVAVAAPRVVSNSVVLNVIEEVPESVEDGKDAVEEVLDSVEDS